MFTRGVRLLGLSVVLFVLADLPATATNVRIVRLSLAQGDVQIDRNAGEGWEQAIVNMPVIGGARIYAADNSKAELEFEDGSSIRLAGPAQITLVELSTNAKGTPVNLIQVNSGAVYVDARMGEHEDFLIQDADGATFAITKPSRLRFTVDQQTASLAVMKGEAVAKGGEAKVVGGGQTYNYVLGQPESAASLNTVRPEPEDAWNQKREGYDDQYASTGSQFSGSDDANAPGVADLGYYGNYADVPGYGAMWQPNDVGPDWDPYGYGAWSYYPDWGWTFVSGYPWGWMPFYYGDWCYVGGRGWWWRPGRGPGHLPGHGTGWHSQPLYSGHPGGNFHAPQAPKGTAAAGHHTVAVAGSGLRVGPIAGTHATNTTPASGVHSTSAQGHSFTMTGKPTGKATGGPAGQVGVDSNLVRGSVVVGQKGSYRLASGASSVRNGYEVSRGSSGSAPRGYAGAGYAGRSGYVGGGGTPRGNAGPPPMHSAPSAPAAAPHASGGGGGGSHVSSGGGGGSHGGGGGGHR